MVYEFKLPDIGEGVVEGEVVRWLVKEGDVLATDQPMVEIMTDKATVEIPTPRAGRVQKLMFAEGQICPVGHVLLVIDESATGKPASSSPAPSAPAPRAPIEDVTVPIAPDASAQAKRSAGAAPVSSVAPAPFQGHTAVVGTTVLATPATRKLARELGVDLATLGGTGPGGRITSEDVRGADTHGGRGDSDGSGPVPARGLPASLSTALRTPPASSAAHEGQADVRLPFRGVRRKIAERMVRARREAAHFTYVEEVDCTQLVALRAKANGRLGSQGVKLSYLPFIIKATVSALKKFPQMNAYLDDAAGEIVQRRQYHVGLASATADGLIVPVIRDADRRSILDVAREIDRLASATKAGRATREELTGSTFTITSLGQLGGVLATPILNHPEVAILGVHKITKRPAVFEDKIVVRDLMNLSISVDHRVVDGYDAARFVADIKESLESPGLLFLESI